MAKLKGRIRSFDERKGYGFIERPGEPDVFVSYTSVLATGDDRMLVNGEEVEFDIIEGKYGTSAIYVTRLSPLRQ